MNVSITSSVSKLSLVMSSNALAATASEAAVSLGIAAASQHTRCGAGVLGAAARSWIMAVSVGHWCECHMR